MPVRDTKVLFAYEVSKKPELAAIMAKVTSLTDPEINSLPYLRWIRTALLSEKARLLGDAAAQTLEQALEDHVVASVTADPTGTLLRWMGEDTWINLDRGSIELRRGRLVWMPDTGGIWYETAFSKAVDPRVRAHSSVQGATTKTNYTARYKAEIEARVGGNVPLMGQGAAQTTLSPHLALLGVRFTR